MMDGEKKLTVYFIRLSIKDVGAKDMKMAFSACKKASLSPEWVNGDEAWDLPTASNVVFVTSEFRGELFEHLAEKDCLVCGPRCLYECLTSGTEIPANRSPVFVTSLRGHVVCTSHINNELKGEIAKLVGWMGGVFSDNLTMAVTVLVADVLNSAKCLQAVERNIPIVSSKWAIDVWTKSLSSDEPGLLLTDHKLPPFKGLNICCSNLPSTVKRQLQQLITDNGGTYSASLIHRQTNVLVSEKPEGDKYKAALSWGLKIVKMSWVKESAEKGVTQPYGQHSTQPRSRPTCSTPTSEAPSFMSNTDISIVPVGSDAGDVNDTVNTQVSSKNSQRPARPVPVRPEPVRPVSPELGGLVEELLGARGGTLLDGLRMYLCGGGGGEAGLRRGLVVAGATVLGELSERVTHVLALSAPSPADLAALDALSSRPPVLGLPWLRACLAKGGLAPTQPFLIHQGPRTAPPPSPLSSKGLGLLRDVPDAPLTPVTPNNPPASRKLFVKTPRPISSADKGISDKNTAAVDAAESGATLDRLCEKETRELREELEPKATHPSASLPCTSDIGGSYFSGLKFVVVGVPEEARRPTEEVIIKGSGQICDPSETADVAVIPLEGTSKPFTATRTVNSLWLEDCAEQGVLVPVRYYHRTLSVAWRAAPLSGTAISLSGFSGKERTFLAHIALMLGSNVQDSFSRKDHVAKGIVKSTHLVCREAVGSKFEAALKWNIPTVNFQWLLEAAISGSVPPTQEFPVPKEAADINESVIQVPEPERESTMSKETGAPDDSPPNADIEDDASWSAPKTSVSFSRRGSTEATLPGPPAQSTPAATPDLQNSTLPGPTPSRLNIQSTPAATPDLQNSTLPGPTPSRLNASASSTKGTPASAIPARISQTPKLPSTPDLNRSPFHQDTPDTPYGQVFEDNPGPQTRKAWKRWLDGLPDYNEPPTKQRRQSTPLKDIMNQFAKSLTDASGDHKVPSTSTPAAAEREKRSSTSSSEVMSSDRESQVSSAIPDTGSKDKVIASKLQQEISRRCSGGTEGLRERLANRIREQEADDSEEDTADNPLLQLRPFADPEETDLDWQQVNKKNYFGSSSTEDSSTLEKTKQKKTTKSKKEVKRLFLLSNIPLDAREKYESIIVNLGGQVNTSVTFDDKITHLVVERPVRNEKLLCSIASGKWVLHVSYLDQCYEARSFIPEEGYEWGNPLSDTRLPVFKAGSTEALLSAACYRWRRAVTEVGGKAFRHMSALLCTTESKRAQFERLLTAGGARLATSPTAATYCFIEENRVPLPPYFSQLVSRKVHCLPPLYLAQYLINDPPPSPSQHWIPAFQQAVNSR